MIKVLVCGMTDYPGGIESFIMNYYRNIDKNKFHFDFLCYENPCYQREITKNHSKILLINRRSKKPLKFYRSLSKIFRDNAYDIFWYNAASLTNIELVKAAKKYNVKRIIIHSHNSKIQSPWYKFFLLSLLHRFHRLIIGKYATDFWSCSAESSKFFYTKKVILSSRHKIIPNAIDPSGYKFNVLARKKYRANLNLNASFVIGTIGRLCYQKNIQFALKVCFELNKLVNTNLLIIGDGNYMHRLKKLAKKLKIQNKVIFLGIRRDISSLLSCMDAFVFPSNFEGFGIASIEAQISGLPVYNSVYIPRETKIIDSVSFLPINSPKKWGAIIFNDRNKHIDRNFAFKYLSHSPFNINNAAKAIQKLLEEKRDD